MFDAGSLSLAAAIFWFAIGYLSGSVPYGLLLARMTGLGDIRGIGSGNIGATNVLRTGSKKVAFATLLMDILKGAVPVVLARYFAGEAAAIVAGFAAFIGHVIPVWLRFKGGKGVATYIGILFALAWQLGLIFGAIWLLLAFVFRYSSISSLGATAAMPVAVYVLKLPGFAILTIPIAAVIIYAHRGNIARLIRGEETKIRLSRGATAE